LSQKGALLFAYATWNPWIGKKGALCLMDRILLRQVEELED